MSFPKKQSSPRLTAINQNQVCDMAIYSGEFFTLSPGKQIGGGPLIRDYCVVRYCTDGTGILIINGEEFRISPGKTYAILSSDVVSEINDSDKPLSFASVSVYGIKPLPYLKEMNISSKNPFFPWEENYAILNTIKEIIAAANEFMRKDELLRIEKAFRLFGALQKHVRKFINDSKQPTMQEKYIVEALHYMEANYNKKITTSDVAQHLNIDRCYFYSLFKKHAGHTPTEHIISLRINKACELLLIPRATVSSVADAIGMDEALFYRQFKRVCLITPKEYQKQNAKK